ncbi:MAG TPA: hypothetical protein PL002_13345, partial [Flavobacteriales bacterium]|nr:hypothetical protein [Flavobacteriales bacterium]
MIEILTRRKRDRLLCSVTAAWQCKEDQSRRADVRRPHSTDFGHGDTTVGRTQDAIIGAATHTDNQDRG